MAAFARDDTVKESVKGLMADHLADEGRHSSFWARLTRIYWSTASADDRTGAALGGLYEVERQARDMSDEDRWRIRQEKAAPLVKTLHDWMLTQRDLVPNGSATAKALDYSLKRWVALTRYLEDGAVPIDNNPVENQIRPWALGRSSWLFAGSLRSGKRAAAIMSLIQSARMNGHDPYAYLKDVLTRLPTQRASEIDQLLPHQWVSA